MCRSSMLFAFLALSACGNDNRISEIDPVLAASPQLLDFQNVAVGSSAELAFQLDHTDGGATDVRNITVTNIDGTFFTFGGEKTFLMEQGASVQVPIGYAPTDEGWHRATVEIVYESEPGTVVLDVRGHGVVPQLTISPLGLDFGPVEPGGEKSLDVTVSNESGVAVDLTGDRVGNDVFTVDANYPLTVDNGTSQDIKVTFRPNTGVPVLSTLVLEVGSVALPTVSLRGNDCENGIPSAYDTDGDGFTTCAGDCDDSDPTINPGAVEVPDFINQDCDNKVDDGTPYGDDDNDGFCDDPLVCGDGSTPGDCADGDAAVSPNGVEDLSNGIDDDCDGVVDLGTSDLDGDGYAPAGGDCDDGNALRAPGLTEVADGVDNDCDVTIDETTSAYDDDGDGFCEIACTDGNPPGDCDDARFDVFPNAAELPDFRDQDCDGGVDEGTVNADDDSDGFTEVGGDCNDADANVNPAAGGCP